ncbi:hypothetical protein CR513_48199, partial [Mucuna pruriens]
MDTAQVNYTTIINGGSNINVTSLRLVEKLGIPTLPHSKPYKLRQVLVDLTIGNHSDEVICDVVPMEATHILLVTNDQNLRSNSLQEEEDDVGMDMKRSMKDMETKDLKGPMTKGRLRKLQEEVQDMLSLLIAQEELKPTHTLVIVKIKKHNCIIEREATRDILNSGGRDANKY